MTPELTQGSPGLADAPVALAVTMRPTGPDMVLEVSGEVDIASAPTLRACLEQCMMEPTGSVILDLADVTFLDSTGVNAIVRANNALVGVERRLIVRNPRRSVRQVFEITGVAGHIPLEHAEGQATA